MLKKLLHPQKTANTDENDGFVTFKTMNELMNKVKKYSNNPVLLVVAFVCALLTIVVQYLPDFLLAKYIGGYGLIVSLVLMVMKSLFQNQLAKPNKIIEIVKKGESIFMKWLKSLTKTQIISGVGFILGFTFTCVALFVPEVAQYEECLYSALSLLGVTATAGITAGKKTATAITANVTDKKQMKLAKKQVKAKEKAEREAKIQEEFEKIKAETVVEKVE